MVSRPCFEAHELRAGVEQHEVAGAVGVLGLAGGEADLADGRRLLVAEVAGDRDLAAERAVGAGGAVGLRGAEDGWIAGSIARGMPKKRQQLVVPVQRVAGPSAWCGWRW